MVLLRTRGVIRLPTARAPAPPTLLPAFAVYNGERSTIRAAVLPFPRFDARTKEPRAFFTLRRARFTGPAGFVLFGRST